MSTASAGAPDPHVRVLRGQPTPEQLAAVVAAVHALRVRAARDRAERAERSYWNRPVMRQSLSHGHSAWRHSLRNR